MSTLTFRSVNLITLVSAGKVGLPWWLSGREESTYQCRRPGFDPWVGRIPWRRKWQPPPVFLPGKSLAGCSPWGRRRVRRALAIKQEPAGKYETGKKACQRYSVFVFKKGRGSSGFPALPRARGICAVLYKSLRSLGIIPILHPGKLTPRDAGSHRWYFKGAPGDQLSSDTWKHNPFLERCLLEPSGQHSWTGSKIRLKWTECSVYPKG